MRTATVRRAVKPGKVRESRNACGSRKASTSNVMIRAGCAFKRAGLKCRGLNCAGCEWRSARDRMGERVAFFVV